jgi:hypothetical protein
VEPEDERRRERRVRIVGIGGGCHGVEFVVGAEREHRPAVARVAAVEPELVVPVQQRHQVGGEAQDQAGIAVAPRDGDRRADLRHRLADQPAEPEEVGVEIEQVLVAACAGGATVDDAAGVAAVEHRRAAGAELDLIDEVGVDHARASAAGPISEPSREPSPARHAHGTVHPHPGARYLTISPGPRLGPTRSSSSPTA